MSYAHDMSELSKITNHIMIKFFRKIRQNLIVQGKTLNYVKYAIGEIVLVVIGILIALEVNNWNNERKDLKKENYYLNSIKTSIELSQDELNRVITDAENIYSCADTLYLLLAHKEYDRLKGTFLDSLLFSAGDYSKISLNDGGIQEILNTGSLDLIKDERIRIVLASWDERMHNIRKWEDESQYISRNYMEYLIHFIDFSRYELDSLNSVVIPEKLQSLFSDPMITNYLGQIYATHRGMKETYSEEKKVMDSLNTLIDQYLIK